MVEEAELPEMLPGGPLGLVVCLYCDARGVNKVQVSIGVVLWGRVG
jgi:hypothetical protein